MARYLRRELQMAMPFHGLEENRQRRTQPLAAEPPRDSLGNTAPQSQNQLVTCRHPDLPRQNRRG
jgi:hypothetical protein